MRKALYACFAILLLSMGAAFAIEPGEALNDPVLESRARVISAQLRCLVCQNQSIDDSQAPLAKDLRLLVRERLTAGDSDNQVMDYLVARYGDFILLKPPFKIETLLLWSAPGAVLLLGLLGLWRANRFRTGAPPAEPLTDAERDELARALNEGNGLG